ncbi:hypothetical protein COU96_01125 [Candidatus Shapirobacteria bacterium CG10_big_fil_rev_8_21_14_0_10_38_14]|uniref:Uncharacterized protein n=1 Tax=Candidatus Shapirobacteria bacterium CG10_big_fil_rev_8_21_14_0_10_38_14 TaxID=1974483 RepID=A0A2M8L5S0_9BACT|nr:MAG: hypothetical protein COU96_01125 [Candidatus Shapirobacteria bacterium CG10_big_fil_rev_8_21_14_0_10_38_14]
MFRKELINRFLFTLIWLVVVTLLRLPAGNWGWYLILFWLGAGFGTLLIDLDHWFYVLVTFPQEGTSIVVRKFLKERRWREATQILSQNAQERIKLPFRNAPFQIFFTIFCFWVLTSTASWFGKGMAMAMLLQLLREEIVLLLKGRDEFLCQRLFWLLQKSPTLKQQKFFVILMLLFFLGLNLLLI